MPKQKPPPFREALRGAMQDLAGGWPGRGAPDYTIIIRGKPTAAELEREAEIEAEPSESIGFGSRQKKAVFYD